MATGPMYHTPDSVETLILMAAASRDFANALLERPQDALAASGLELTPVERAMVRAMEPRQLRQLIHRVGDEVHTLDSKQRRHFLQLSAAALVALVGGSTLSQAGCDRAEAHPARATPSRPRSGGLRLAGERPPEELRRTPRTGSRPTRPRPVRPNPGLPRRLPSSEVRRGVRRIVARARGCYSRYRVKGSCRVRIVIQGSTGRVIRASVRGKLAGTHTGRCIKRAARSGRFKRFRKATMTVAFPVRFK